MKFTTKVIHGNKHGNSIGYPTANLKVTKDVHKVLARYGIYVVKVLVRGRHYKGLLFWGIRSLFEDTKPRCEVLILDFSDELYGEEITIEAVTYLRPVQQLKDEHELKQLIEQDLKQVV
jgi:riboflavin kinase / FMN adenylyltransferase